MENAGAENAGTVTSSGRGGTAAAMAQNERTAEEHSTHRRSQGVHWVHVHSQGGEKMWEPNLQGKVVSAPQAERAPPRQSKSPFLGNWGELDGGSG